MADYESRKRTLKVTIVLVAMWNGEGIHFDLLVHLHFDGKTRMRLYFFFIWSVYTTSVSLNVVVTVLFVS